MERRSSRLAFGAPDVRCHIEQVPRDLRVAFPAGHVEGVPAVLVLQRGVGAVAQQLLDDAQVPPSAGHHQGSPGPGREITQGRYLLVAVLKEIFSPAVYPSISSCIDFFIFAPCNCAQVTVRLINCVTKACWLLLCLRSFPEAFIVVIGTDL